MTLTGRMEKVFTAIRLEERRTILSGIEQSPPLFLNKTGYGNSPSWHTVQRDEIHFRIVEQHALLTTAKRPSFTCTYYLPPPPSPQRSLSLSTLFLLYSRAKLERARHPHYNTTTYARSCDICIRKQNNVYLLRFTQTQEVNCQWFCTKSICI